MVRNVLGVIMFWVMIMIVGMAIAAGIVSVARGQPTVQYGSMTLDVKLTRNLWVWLEPHVTQACQAKPYRFVDVSPDEISIGLSGSFDALKCAKEVIDREQRLNRYEERLSHFRNLGKRNFIAGGDQGTCGGCKCDCRGVPYTK